MTDKQLMECIHSFFSNVQRKQAVDELLKREVRRFKKGTKRNKLPVLENA